MGSVKDYFEKLWEDNRHKLEITSYNNTWLHRLAKTIHLLGKFTALIPNIRRKYKKKPISLDPKLAEQLQNKVELYLKEIKRHQDDHGFILHEHCDSTLMSGLLSANPEIEIDLKAARDDKGFWKRRPTENPCYPDHSASSISRDMMLGVYWHLFETKNLDLAEKTYEHAKSNNFVMGVGDPARLIMMPSGEATLADICYKLGGKNRFLARHQLQIWPKQLKGYQVHLLVMHILLRGRIHNQIDSKMFKALRHYAKTNPTNPLHQYAYGIYSNGDLNNAAMQLLNEKWWPNDRLPQKKDRSSAWITERDYGKDWRPSKVNPDKEHSGGDFLVVAYLILEEYKKRERGKQ